MRAIEHPTKADAFIDGELDLRSQLDMEDKVREDPVLRQHIDQLRQLRGTLRDGASYHQAPAALQERIVAWAPPSAKAAAAARAASSSHPFGSRSAWARWLDWRPLTASVAAALALAVGLNVAWMRASQDEQMADDVVASHVRSTLGAHLVDVTSSDHHTVKPFLSERLGFSPPVQELDLAGSTLVGGRVDYLDGRPVAALVFKQGLHIVNSFVWPSTHGDQAPAFSLDRGFRMAHWTQSGMTHWVISDVNAEEFRNVVRAIRVAETGG
jgi:anti-sigma factor RsiW